MSTSPSTIKITRPRPAVSTGRKRLFKLLDQEAHRPVTWLSGPAGSGKTTLVSGYLVEQNIRPLWYQVDEGDSDASTFFYYMGLAAKQAMPRCRKQLPLLTAEHVLPLPLFARTFFLEVFARLKPPCVLVFDNYQELPADSKLHAILSSVFSQLPEGVRIFVLSRREPEVEYARLRANGALGVVGWDDLRFTPEETEEVVRRKIGRAVPEDVELLQQATEGWIAGLVLLLERMKKKGHVAEILGTVSRESIFDYFAGELIASVNTEIQDFLFKTAFLPQMSPLMAGILTGSPNAARILSTLHRNNFFTHKLDRHTALYQYHQLFREFLMSRAADTFTSRELADIRRNAASLLEAADRIEDAVALFQRAHEWTEAARLVCKHAPALKQQGRIEIIRDWVTSLPEAVVDGHAELLYWRGICLAPVHPAESDRDLVKAFDLFKMQNDRSWMFTVWADIVDRSFLQNEYAAMRKWRGALKEILAQDTTFPSKEIELRITMSLFNSMAMNQPDDPEIPALSDRALELIENDKTLDVNHRITTGVYLNVYYVWTGNLSRARRIAHLFNEIGRSVDVSDLTLLYVQSTTCLFTVFTADHDACMKTMTEAFRVAERSGIHLRTDHITCHGISSALSAGDMTKADELLASFGSRVAKALRFDQEYYHILKAWKAMIDGNASTAFEHQTIAMGIGAAVPHVAAQAVIHFGMADILFHLSKPEEAERELSRGFEISRRIKSTILEFMGSLIEAEIAFGREKEDRAFEALRRAMTVGRENDFLNMMWWRTSLIAPLCVKALESGIEVKYVQHLIKRRNLVPDAPPVHIENWPWPLRIYSLGRFELLGNNMPVTYGGKVQQKPLAMLKVLIAEGGRDVDERVVTDALWPEAEGDLARRSFDTTLHRLRKVLADDRVILLQDRKVTLDERYCWVDTFAFERLLQCVQAVWQSGGHDANERLRIRAMAEKAIALYPGHFLPGDRDEAWSVSLRERLRSKYLTLVGKLGRHHMDTDEHEQAVAVFQRGLDVDDLSEEFYQNLMICYLKLGRKAEAATTYRRCCATLKTALDLTPSSKTEEIYRRVLL